MESIAFIKNEIEESAFGYHERYRLNQDVVVGVNEFVEDTAEVEEILSVDPASERDQLERLKAFKADRDQDLTDAAPRRAQAGRRGHRQPAAADPPGAQGPRVGRRGLRRAARGLRRVPARDLIDGASQARALGVPVVLAADDPVEVVAAIPVEAAAAVDLLVDAPAGEHAVVAVTAVGHVAAASGIDHVVAGVAVELLVGVAADQPVVTAAAADDLDVARRRRRPRRSASDRRDRPPRRRHRRRGCTCRHPARRGLGRRRWCRRRRA